MKAPQQLLAIGEADLLSAIVEYVVESKAGDTLSYRETAALDVEVAARSSAGALWNKLKARGLEFDGRLVVGEALDGADREAVAARPGEIVELTAEPARLRFDLEQASDLAQCFIDEPGAQFDVFAGADGKTLFAQSVRSPQNGAFAIGAGSTGELVDEPTDGERALAEIPIDVPAASEPDSKAGDNSAFFG